MYPQLLPARPSLADRIGSALAGLRDALDARGRVAWIAFMIAGFILAGPLGFAILAYMIWSNRMFASCKTRAPGFTATRFGASTGNVAFDAYRAETLRRLEDEHREFVEFLAKLREAKDKAEFDAFMEQRKPE